MIQPPGWPLLILLFLRSRACLHPLTRLLALAHPQPTKNPRIPTNTSKYVWLKELELEYDEKKNIRKSPSIPTHPCPTEQVPETVARSKKVNKVSKCIKARCLGMKTFTSKKTNTKNFTMFLFHLHVQPGSLGWMFLPENPGFFLFAFPWLFPGFEHKKKQSTFDRWEERWTNDPILQPKKQTFQILGMFMQFTQKTPITWTMIITEPQLVALECFPRLKRGQIASRRGVGCFWNYIGSLDNANLVEAKGR